MQSVGGNAWDRCTPDPTSAQTYESLCAKGLTSGHRAEIWPCPRQASAYQPLRYGSLRSSALATRLWIASHGRDSLREDRSTELASPNMVRLTTRW